MVCSRSRGLLPKALVLTLLALCFWQVIAAFISNMVSKPDVVSWFVLYFMAVGLVIVLGFQRVRLLKIAFKIASATWFGGL